MISAGLVALCFASAFSGSAIYISIVEQPARLSMDSQGMLAEWKPSDRRAVVLLGTLALVSAIFGFVDYSSSHDLRWLLGATVIIASWPYMFFLLVPINNRLLAASGAEVGPLSREFIRDWGFLEWGLAAIGVFATGIFAWAID